MFDSDGKYLNEAQNCVIKYLQAHSLWRNLEKKHTDFFSEFIWEVSVGRTKLMALTLPWQIKLQ